MAETIVIEDLDRCFNKLIKAVAIEKERKEAEDNATAGWFFKKLAELGEMNLDKLIQLKEQPIVLSKEPTEAEKKLYMEQWVIDYSDWVVYCRLRMTPTKSRGVQRLLTKEIADAIKIQSGWEINHNQGSMLTFSKRSDNAII